MPFLKVDVRLAFLVTLYLITANVYGAVEAPVSRGFSFIEIWMVGIQITILLAIFEYALILLLKKSNDNKGTIQVEGMNNLKPNSLSRQPNTNLKKIDKCTMFISALFFLIFNIGYWTTAKLK